jgi:hypothetical protein
MLFQSRHVSLETTRKCRAGFTSPLIHVKSCYLVGKDQVNAIPDELNTLEIVFRTSDYIWVLGAKNEECVLLQPARQGSLEITDLI